MLSEQLIMQLMPFFPNYVLVKKQFKKCVNALLVPIFFDHISILVFTFSFHHFYSLNQLMLVILVISISQQTEKADMAVVGIKILLKKLFGIF